MYWAPRLSNLIRGLYTLSSQSPVASELRHPQIILLPRELDRLPKS